MSLLFGRGHNAESLMSGDSMDEPQPKESLLKKSGRIGAILGFVWIALNIVVPLALLRVPAVQRWLVAFDNKLPFHIPGIG